MFLYIHVGNMLFIDNTPYKSVFNGLYGAIFLELFDNVRGEDRYLLGSIFLYLEIFIRPDIVFPPLLNIIPLIGLDVLIQIIQDFLKCYLWNVVVFTYPHFVIVWNWNWNKKYLINYSSSNFAYLNISKISFWKKLLKKFNFIAWILFILFIFKASSFCLVAVGLNFTFLQPFGGHLAFFLIYMVAAKLWYVCFQSMLSPNS